MRLVGRNLGCRRSEPQAALANLDKDYNQHLSFVPEKRVNQLHFAKRDTCPTVYFGNQHHMRPNLQEPNSSVKCSTRLTSTNKQDNEINGQCRILTLQQIKMINQPALNENTRNSSRMKSARKLFVSISKSNRTSESKQSKTKAEPKLSEIGGQFNLLRSLSNKKKIVDTVEIQMHENIPKNSFFCR